MADRVICTVIARLSNVVGLLHYADRVSDWCAWSPIAVCMIPQCSGLSAPVRLQTTPNWFPQTNTIAVNRVLLFSMQAHTLSPHPPQPPPPNAHHVIALISELVFLHTSAPSPSYTHRHTHTHTHPSQPLQLELVSSTQVALQSTQNWIP